MPLAIVELTNIALFLSIISVLMVISVVSSRYMERLGVPVVLLFLLLGILAGSEGIGGIEFSDYHFAFQIGTIALILILFDGGLNTSLSLVRGQARAATVLATLGVAGTAALLALAARLLGLDWGESLLLGAVVSSTDAAAVFAVLRGGGLNLSKRVGTTLELESGVNDPMAVILTLGVIEVLGGNRLNGIALVFAVPLQLLIGLAIGVLLGYGMRGLLRKIRLTTVGLYPVLTLALSLVSFGLTTLAGGSGFLAVYTSGLVLGNGPIPYRAGLVRIHDAVAWLSQISMFLALGLLVFPSQLLEVAGVGLALGLLMAFVARPLVVALCLLPFRFPAKEIGYIGWVGLKGAVPIILSTFPVLTGVPGAERIFNLVFFVVVVNWIIPGATIRWVTRRLQLEAPETPNPLAALEIHSTRLLNGELMSFFVSEPLAVCHVPVGKIPFPPGSSAVLLVRGEQLIAPRGSTVLRPGDHVYVFCRPEDTPFVQFLFGRPQEHG